MTILTAENCYREGLVALMEGRPEKACNFFEAAMLTERQHNVPRPQMRYLSYFGLSRAMAQGPSRDTIRACESAAREEFFNVDLLLNLGKVYLLAGKVTKALNAFERGLQVDPTHKGLLAAMRRADRRRQPPVPWLQRNHPLNHWLGRMRRV